MTTKYGGTIQPSAHTAWITVTHSRLAGCFVRGRPRRSELVTTFTLENVPIMKPSLVKVIDIPLLDCVFVDYIAYKPKLRVYYTGIFALGPLIIDLVSETRSNLGMSLYKTVCPSGSDARRAAYSPKTIGALEGQRARAEILAHQGRVLSQEGLVLQSRLVFEGWLIFRLVVAFRRVGRGARFVRSCRSQKLFV